jgi:plasmid stability protein
MQKNQKRSRRRIDILPKGGTIQYTVRNIPAHADKVLRQKAAEEKKSLNEILRQAILKEAGGSGLGETTYHDLDELAGTWEEDPDFDEAIAAQDKIDPSLWK